jgi:hypothetical protein
MCSSVFGFFTAVSAGGGDAGRRFYAQFRSPLLGNKMVAISSFTIAARYQLYLPLYLKYDCDILVTELKHHYPDQLSENKGLWIGVFLH